MVLFLLLGAGIVCAGVAFVICMFTLDCDLATTYYDKFGEPIQHYFKGQVVWITGASTGIGKSLAEEAARAGAKIVLTARRENLLNNVRESCIRKGAKEADILVLPMDMCDYSAHQGAVERILEHFGRLSVIIHNAGRSQRARWEHTQIQVDKDLFDLNVFSVVNLTRLALPHMLSAGGGCIAIMSSTAGKSGVPFSGSYTGSKHALHGYFESLRNEKVGTGLEVCMLCPGPTFSDLLQVAATENPGEQFGENMSPHDKRMTSERCARLSLVAIANKISESWICFAPVLPLMYINQYTPGLGKALLRLVGPKYLAKVRDSRNTMEAGKDK